MGTRSRYSISAKGNGAINLSHQVGFDAVLCSIKIHADAVPVTVEDLEISVVKTDPDFTTRLTTLSFATDNFQDFVSTYRFELINSDTVTVVFPNTDANLVAVELVFERT